MSEVVSFMEKHKRGKSDGDYWAVMMVRGDSDLKQATDNINERVNRHLEGDEGQSRDVL